MNWLTIVQNISTFITGQFGIGLVTVAIGISGARSAITHQWGHFWSAVGGGGVLMSAAWVVQTFL